MKEKSSQIVQSIDRPFFGYNCCFETGVLFHSCGLEVEFDGDLMKEKTAGIKWEKKQEAIAELNISDLTNAANSHVEALVETLALGGDYKAIHYATPEGLIIGIDAGIEVTAIKIKDEFGKEMTLIINLVDKITATKSGKRRFVISKISNL